MSKTRNKGIISKQFQNKKVFVLRDADFEHFTMTKSCEATATPSKRHNLPPRSTANIDKWGSILAYETSFNERSFISALELYIFLTNDD